MIADYQQPDVWVGHIEMQTDQLEASEAFMIALGMRAISKNRQYCDPGASRGDPSGSCQEGQC